ncbi:MAG TPA: hypothetical protein VIM55_06295 [Mucilaginibacter sp.]
MKLINNITIPTPCRENWSQMTPVEQGWHCACCCKTVIDFTLLTDAEVINYLTLKNNVCGRFSEDQLHRINNQQQRPALVKSIWKRVAMIALITGFFSLTRADGQVRKHTRSHQRKLAQSYQIPVDHRTAKIDTPKTGSPLIAKPLTVDEIKINPTIGGNGVNLSKINIGTQLSGLLGGVVVGVKILDSCDGYSLPWWQTIFGH